MFKNRTEYIRALFGTETELLREIRATSLGENDKIGIHPEEGRFLQMLLIMSGAKKVVEIGTLHGYSASCMADVLPRDGMIWTIEKDAARARQAEKNISPYDNITLLTGEALDLLHALEEQGPFDMLFIDADKVNYLNYLDWAEKNLRQGGVIIGDNTFLFDAVWKDEPVDRVRDTARHAMRTFNMRLADPQKYLGVLLPIEEGMTVAVKLF